jgi:transposase
MLAAAAGLANAHIARRLGITPNTVRKWRKRYAAQGLAGLTDRKRTGRPRIYPGVVVAQAKAVACELPATRGVPLSRWSVAELRAELLASGLVTDISTTTLWRWLATDPIKPWQHRSWIFPRDPNFAAKATVVLDLYQRSFAGVPLGAGLPGRLGRAPRPPVRPLRTHHRDRAVRSAGCPGHDHRALRLC